MNFLSLFIVYYIPVLIDITIGPDSSGAIRLHNANGASLYNTAGRVQVWYGGVWGNICDDDSSFSTNEADVICHQLGWSGASSYSYGASDGSVRHVSRYYLRAVKCHGIVHVVDSRPSTVIIWNHEHPLIITG